MGIQPRPSIGSPNQATEFMELGVKHFCMGNDLIGLWQWINTHFEELRKLVEKG